LKEYLPALQTRSKWTKQSTNFKIVSEKSQKIQQFIEDFRDLSAVGAIRNFISNLLSILESSKEFKTDRASKIFQKVLILL
jgi:uncharacterized protein YjgD (DUF1641 family)